MKRSTLTLTAMITLLSLNSFAQTNAIPGVSAPAGFDEGIATRLTPEQLAAIEPWAKHSQLDLVQLLDDLKYLPVAEQKDQLFRNIRDVVIASAPKNTETLMRYVLNRGLKVVQVLDEESVPGSIGLLDQQVRILKLSADFALKYYESDMAFLTGKASTPSVELPFAKFGQEYAAFLMKFSESILDVSAQYRVELMAQGFLAWDLYRDKDQAKYAPIIVRLNAIYKTLPEKSDQNDPVTVIRLQQIRRAYQAALKALGALRNNPESGNVDVASDSTDPWSVANIKTFAQQAIGLSTVIAANKLIEEFHEKHKSKILTMAQILPLVDSIKFLPAQDDQYDERTRSRIVLSFLATPNINISTQDALLLADKQWVDLSWAVRTFYFAKRSKLNQSDIDAIVTFLNKQIPISGRDAIDAIITDWTKFKFGT